MPGAYAEFLNDRHVDWLAYAVNQPAGADFVEVDARKPFRDVER